jgi:glycosyltransferase involved in cell wall biosynthesis
LASTGQPQDLVLVQATLSPYFDHFHRRIQSELPLRPVALYTHARHVWQMDPGTDAYENHVLGGLVASEWDRSVAAHRREWRIGGDIIAFLRRRRPAAVILIGYRDPARLRVARWCRRHGVPVLAWTDANALGAAPPSGWRGALKGAYIRWIDRRVSGWLVCGSPGETYLSQFGIDLARVHRSPCAPNYTQIQSVTEADVTAAASSLKLDLERRRLVCSGRMVPTKRFDLVIDAFAAVAEERRGWDLLVLGQGPEQSRLRARVPSHLRDRVIFGGFVADPRTLWAVYKACHVLVHLADHEPWGLIVNEAAACGMAMVCSDVVGAAAELLRDGDNGRRVPRGDVSAAGAALREVTGPALERMRSRSPAILDEWRRAADPIAGLAAALRQAGALPPA